MNWMKIFKQMRTLRRYKETKKSFRYDLHPSCTQEDSADEQTLLEKLAYIYFAQLSKVILSQISKLRWAMSS